MSDNLARSFVLVHGDNGAVILGASSISPVRVLTDNPGEFPDSLVLEGGQKVPLVMLDADTMDRLSGDAPAPVAVAAPADAPAIDPALLQKAGKLLEAVRTPWPGDVPPVDAFMPQADDMERQLKDAIDQMNALARQTSEAVSRGQEQWSALMGQLEELKNNYSLLMEERDQLKEIVDTLSST